MKMSNNAERTNKICNDDNCPKRIKSNKPPKKRMQLRIMAKKLMQPLKGLERERIIQIIYKHSLNKNAVRILKRIFLQICIL